jgi:glycyl-tRNA synthetase alpha chain
MYEQESKRVIELPVYWNDELKVLSTQKPSQISSQPSQESGPWALVYPAFDLALKCSHIFNLLDARGAISAAERAAYIHRIRARVRACCLRYLEQFPKKAAP